MATDKDKKSSTPPQSLQTQVKSIEGMLVTPAIADKLRGVQTEYLTPDRLTRILLTEVARPDKNGKFALLECAQANPASFLRAVMACCQLGLEPGPIGLVYLIPFGTEVQFIVGFKGYVNLACRSGFSQVDAATIHEGDHFEHERGTTPFIRHRPAMNADRGAMVGAYAIAWPSSGGPPRFAVLDLAALHRARASSMTYSKYKTGPWLDHEGEMAKKTAIRRGSKLWNLVPTSPLALAAGLDDDAIETTAEVREPRKAPPTLW